MADRTKLIKENIALRKALQDLTIAIERNREDLGSENCSACLCYYSEHAEECPLVNAEKLLNKK